MAHLAHQHVTCAGTTLTPTAASSSGDSTDADPGVVLEFTNSSGGERTVTFAGDHAALVVREVFDNGPLPAGWLQPYTEIGPEVWDEISVVDGHITLADPDDGPQGWDENYDSENPTSGARACAYKDFGADYTDDVEVSIVWAAYRPIEATPLAHVDPETTEGGIGVWPGSDLFPDTPGPQPVWVFGYIGGLPEEFDPVSTVGMTLADFPTHAARTLTIRSTGDQAWALADGEIVAGPIAVPESLRGLSTHGFALDHNQTDEADPPGAGGTRPPNLPGCRHPFEIRKTDTTGAGDLTVTIADGATVLVGPVDTPRLTPVDGVTSWTYDDHTDVTVAAVRLDPTGHRVT